MQTVEIKEVKKTTLVFEKFKDFVYCKYSKTDPFGDIPMKVNLVFDDWRDKDHKSIYSTEKGTDFHSGTTFDAKIYLDEKQTAELKKALEEGFRPVFYISNL